MINRIQTLIFYTAAFVLLLVVYHFATSFGFAVVDEGYRYMEPTVGQRETLLLDKRRSTVLSLERGDLIAYTSVYKDRTMRMFARVAALPGKTISVRDQRLLVEGDDVARAPHELNLLQTGLMVPRDSVFVIFDSPLGKRIPVPQRLVPYRNILGRAVGE